VHTQYSASPLALSEIINSSTSLLTSNLSNVDVDA
jgi:hypothetical protein